MNILYLSQYYPPEVCAPAARVEGFARAWVQAGAKVGVVTGFPNHPEGVLHEPYRKLWRKGFHREEKDGVEVYRMWLYPSANRNLWGRGANFASFAISATAAGTCVAPQKGVIIATSPQILVGAAGWAVGTARGLPWVFEVRDLWPESLAGVGQTSENSCLYRGVGRLAQFLYRRATYIVVDGQWKRRHLESQGVDEKRIAVIPSGVEADFCLDPESNSALRARHMWRTILGLRGEMVVLYAGTLGMAHGLGTLLRAAERLRHRPDIVFVIVGAGAEREILCRRVAESRLANVRILEKQPRETIPAILAAADVCVIPLRDQKVFETAIPSKMIEAMAAGKAVILGVRGEAKEILLGAEAGLAIPPEDPEAIARAILWLQNEPGMRQVLGQNGRRAVLQNYLRSRQAARYLDLLHQLCNEPRTVPLRAPIRPPELSFPVAGEAVTGTRPGLPSHFLPPPTPGSTTAAHPH
jgi:glycosyltransferase involved in cell wall biosynthesis